MKWDIVRYAAVSSDILIVAIQPITKRPQPDFFDYFKSDRLLEHALKWFWSQLCHGASVRGRYRFRDPQSHYVWLSLAGAPVFERDAKARSIISTCVILANNVTAEVLAEQSARAHAKHLGMMQDLAGLAWWVLDFEDGSVQLNETFVELTGCAASVLRSVRQWCRMVYRADRPMVLSQWRALRKHQHREGQALELRLNQPGSGWRWVRITMELECACVSGHTPLQWHGVMLDIDQAVRGRELVTRWMRNQSLSRERERLALAHQLHDEVGQILTGLRWELEAAARQWAMRPDGERGPQPAWQDWIGHIESANRTLRGVAQKLRPTLPTLGLRAALESLVQEFANSWLRSTAIRCRFPDTLADGDEWRLEVALGLVRECLNNVARHAKASMVLIEASNRPNGWIEIRVSDDGVGINWDAAGASERIGLLSLQERARQLGGKLDIQSSPHSGTSVCLAFNPQREETH